MCNLPSSCFWVGLCCLCQVLKRFTLSRQLRRRMSGCLWMTSTFLSEKLLLFHSFCRNREIKRIKGRVQAGNSFAFICNDISELEHSNQVNLPRVTVIMPLKGFGEHNLHNWRSQVSFFLFLFGGVRGLVSWLLNLTFHMLSFNNCPCLHTWNFDFTYFFRFYYYVYFNYYIFVICILIR